jgi:hypothetical protein
VLAQRRHVHSHHRQPKVQVRAEAAAIDFFAQVAVAGRDHPGVDAARAIRPERLDLAPLERPEQARLQLER